MVPSKSWFPTKLQDRAAWYQNFITQFNSIGTALGITPAEVITLTNDSAVMTSLADAAPLLSTYTKAVREFRIYITEGNVGEPEPEFPTAPSITVTGTPTGMFERLIGIVDRIRVAPAYTPEIGALLGILPQSTGKPAPATMQPVLKVSAVPGNKVSVSFKRGFSNGVVFETKVDNAATWSEAGRFYASPAELVIPENAQGLPRSVQVRARYIDGDEAVGLYSTVDTVSTQPAA